MPIDPARAFDRQGLPARFAVILAGVTMNFIFAVLVYTGLAYAGRLQPGLIATTQVDTVRVSELPAAAAPLATLRRGDRITRVNGDTVRNWGDLLAELFTAQSPVRVHVAGRAQPIVLNLPPSASADTGIRWNLVRHLVPYLQPVIATVTPSSPAREAGLEPGDRIIRVGDDTVESWNDFARIARTSPGKALRLTILRRDSARTVAITPESHTERDSVTGQERSYGMIGVSAVQPTAPPQNLGGAVTAGWRETMQHVNEILTFLNRLVRGRASPRELGGPITIAQVSGQAARAGIAQLLVVMAFLSINLAILNLLPIPILDGGQLVFLVAEGLRRKPLSLNLRLRLTQFGFAVIAALMLFVFGNELFRLIQHAFS